MDTHWKADRCPTYQGRELFDVVNSDSETWHIDDLFDFAIAKWMGQSLMQTHVRKQARPFEVATHN